MYGQICYGILIEEGAEFPWDVDHEAWWRDVNDYKPLWCPYTKYGGYKPGVKANDPRIKEYFNHQNDWHTENPFPITIVEYGCCEFSEVILAVTSSLIDGIESFHPEDLIVSKEDRDTLLNFCQRWNIESDDPKWWLSSYRG